MIFVLKRDDRKVRFHESKITDAIVKAAEGTGSPISAKDVRETQELAIELINAMNKDLFTVEEIQDTVVRALMEKGHTKLAKDYNKYRLERTRQRETKSELMKIINKIGVETDRDNANVGNNFSAKLLRIASESNK
jgi:ribonucleoside-triphosphate reductase